MPGMNMPTSRTKAEFGFIWPVRVYYEDTDAGGIVFYANYLKYFERARTEWLRACEIDQCRLDAEAGLIFVVRSAALDYRAAARLDDLLTIGSRIERLGGASVEFMQEAWRGDELLATGSIRVACVARATLKPVPLPSPVRAALSRGACVDTVLSTVNAQIR
ncbi:MAG TPA: tol-pal system-associated acyl-CoA thioesterase [Trinickia sp.]|jgi:acyl-CoA thioester hydrolase|uniref:tol-pal system-associated acyl-CoA thioesterase n=1 Tax=Trinickia sp. TaxID=2571163 RepID=UPI002C9034E1|nr:tol-pal system-associated acyl-CoA thioesterase [Trinickia sp.]HTI18843.1 tol-pal system-associated acyl-CoA thioesterase [Trinickia sp.]